MTNRYPGISGYRLVYNIRKEYAMLALNGNKNINYIRILNILKILRKEECISNEEYENAKVFYLKFTDADIVIAD